MCLCMPTDAHHIPSELMASRLWCFLVHNVSPSLGPSHLQAAGEDSPGNPVAVCCRPQHNSSFAGCSHVSHNTVLGLAAAQTASQGLKCALRQQERVRG